MEYMDVLLAFITGVLITLIGAWVNIFLNKKSEQYSMLRSAEYEMYLKLGDLYNWYFWFVSNEMHRRDTEQDVTDECYKLAMELARLLHQYEDTEFAGDLLRILYDESYENYRSRWEHMAKLSANMAEKIAPIHLKHLSPIDEANMEAMAREDYVPKAPALYRFKLRV